LRVRSGQYSAVNDDTPDKPTEIYYTQEQYCNNPSCDNYDRDGKKVVDVIKHKVNLSKHLSNGRCFFDV
jgi:hypothetical protein